MMMKKSAVVIVVTTADALGKGILTTILPLHSISGKEVDPLQTTHTNKNSRKKTIKDSNGNIKICPPVSAEEHLAVQRETKARTTLLTALPDDHMGEFLHLDGWPTEIWLEI
ncbi:hypothetical protein Tco_0336494 [Tanacetum coccineum]